ncbi:hypothetical protein VHEMI06083 [[Torrubiella] hemipterigena]|uniref:Cytochrome c oxidase assembly protein COX20, mitochondrial n=1 Tax=[Torrubiella] hemipterigena TaxID=1531966 RepID=A0A0A1TI85_9HYPO|nr:hypothetical protein VHEMI06083 [[Torrubiella] hemipterigena]
MSRETEKMSSSPQDSNAGAAGGTPGSNQKTLQVWSEPLKPEDQKRLENPSTTPSGPVTISAAVSTIKKEDFGNIAQMPCARGGLLTGIASGATVGGLRFVMRGNVGKAANWAVGFFLLGSAASYEYCQYKRRAERIQMQRTIEVVAEKKREQAKKAEEAKQKREEERKKAEHRWYKFW